LNKVHYEIIHAGNGGTVLNYLLNPIIPVDNATPEFPVFSD
jgi:hypothetical protein